MLRSVVMAVRPFRMREMVARYADVLREPRGWDLAEELFQEFAGAGRVEHCRRCLRSE